jgi:hypothetical protein
LGQISSLLPNPNVVTFFNVTVSPQLESTVSIAENTIQNVGSADPLKVIEHTYC